jgi:uncharacterized tellurite resistance protein B-like protein
VKSLIRSWFTADDPSADEHGALRGLLDALDRLEPDHARYIAQFAYLLGRIAHADQHVTPEEIRTMEVLVRHEGNLSEELAVLVIGLARTSHKMFGGTDNFIVARDFAAHATYAQRMALMRCLFAVSVSEGNISIAEEREIQRIARELRIEQSDLVALRLEHRRHLPGLSDRAES